MKTDSRFILLVVMLVIFCGWLALVAFWFVPLLLMTGGGALDPMMALIAGLGIGGVTNSFIVLLTLSWQFYFRKRETSEVVNGGTVTTK
ncbi:unnamed protein product [marine sediment metagenome]|uniref:Uncharacterized protein n=1 Tax=marine sediment metagenome TaxID=412755 RepID=X1GVY0_9ZZZZ